MVTGVDFTRHGRQRMSQRATSERDVDVILYFGTAVGSDAVLLTEKDANRAIQCLERLKNRKVILGKETVITVYRANRTHQKAVLRRARAIGQH
jgi:hypothetical protein